MNTDVRVTFYICALAISGAAYAQAAPAEPDREGAVPSQPVSDLQNDSEAPAAKTSGSNSGSQLEEIVVTARKSEENLQKAPATILAVSGEELENRGFTGPLDLVKVLPNTSLREQGPVAQTFIRGVGSRIDFPNVSSPSAFTYNGIIIPRFGTSGILFDLGSVQAIAGPQGTLYGGSAAGGAINTLTAKPTYDGSGKILLSGGNKGNAQVTGNQNAALSDRYALRVAGAYNRHSGYQDRGLDQQSKIQGRVSLLAEPIDELTALLFASASSTRGNPGSVGTIYERPLQDDPWAVPSEGPAGNPVTTEGLYSNYRTYVVGANIDWSVGAGTLTYIPGYVHVDSDYRFFLAGYNPLDVHDKENQFSQELRYAVNVGNLALSGGLFWLRNETDYAINISVAALPEEQGYYLDFPVNRTAQVNESYSAFAQGIYSLTDRLRITLGGRISVDEVEASGAGQTGAPFSFHRKQTQPDWKVGVDYDVTDSVLLYANLQTGYIPFGYDPDSGTPTTLVPESELLAYSAGFKARLFGNRLEVNNEFFYYEYDDFQALRFNSDSGSSTVLNAPESRIYGTDLTTRFLFSDRTSINVGVVAQSAIHTQFSGEGYDFSDNRMANAPELVIRAGIQQGFDIGDGTLLAEVQTNYNSGFWGDFTNSFGTFQRRYIKTDLSLIYTPYNERWSIQAFVNNVEDTAVFSTLTPNSDPEQRGTGKPEAPRIFGLRLTASWD